jgi:phage terminase small subunit
MSQPLNPRQRLFVEQYLVDLNGKAAAIRAGYARDPAVRAARLLRRADVKAAIAAAMAARAGRTGVTPERVLAEYAAIAFADLRRFADWGPAGVRFRGTRALAAEDTRLVAELVAGGRDEGLRRVKLFDKFAALRSLLRILDCADIARFRAAPAAAPSAAVDAGAGLTERQRCFAEEFLVDFDAGAAAIRAGYAPLSAPFQATRLRRYPAIAARIEAGIAARCQPIRADADRVLAEYARIAFADIGRIAAWSARRLRLKPKHRVALGDSAAIDRIGPEPGVTLRLRLYDKVHALDMLAQHLGLLDPRMPGRALARKWQVQRTSAALRARLGR